MKNTIIFGRPDRCSHCFPPLCIDAILLRAEENLLCSFVFFGVFVWKFFLFFRSYESHAAHVYNNVKIIVFFSRILPWKMILFPAKKENGRVFLRQTRSICENTSYAAFTPNTGWNQRTEINWRIEMSEFRSLHLDYSTTQHKYSPIFFVFFCDFLYIFFFHRHSPHEPRREKEKRVWESKKKTLDRWKRRRLKAK